MSVVVPESQSVLPQQFAEIVSSSDRRNHERKDFQTVVTILLTDPSGEFRILRGWSRDISLGGAKVICREDWCRTAATGKNVYFKFLTAEMAGKAVEGEIVSKGNWEKTDFHNRPIAKFFQYGIRFLRLVEDKQILDKFGAALQG